ncbi:ABC transporter permease [Cognatishimia sp.]|uniref:ABC transporter permease n=1 Tax=Cognatishimia sp. TaxID=2211648 RepID=UPI003516EB29
MKQLRTQFRVVFALVLREARVRHGRTRIGYLWAIIEPVLLTTILTVLFTQFRTDSPMEGGFALFFATGVLAFQAYRNPSQYVSGAFDQNQQLFNYPLVKPMDAAYARMLLDVATNLFVMFLVLSFQVIVFDAPLPADVPRMSLALFLLFAMSFGAGTSLAVLRRFWPSMINVYLVIMGPAFFVSCVFFSLDSVPTFYREILAINPLVHGVEGFRAGYYSIYPDSDLNMLYLFGWVVVLNCFGLVGEWLTRFKNI